VYIYFVLCSTYFTITVNKFDKVSSERYAGSVVALYCSWMRQN